MDNIVLSLETFEPARSYAPYLTTPRSIEACRMNGIQPIELVEVPVTEFQKDFPNDPDAAQRRYLRIDGARQRILDKVKTDWAKLVKANWQESRKRSTSAQKKERILEVPEDSHCALLESQADSFRKIEQEHYNALQRMLKLEVQKAVNEINNKKILGRQAAIDEQNEALADQREASRRALITAEIERQRKKDEDFRADTKRLQLLDAAASKKAAEDKALKELKDRRFRETNEALRIARMEQTKLMKQSIMGDIENKAEANRRMLEMKNKSLEEKKREDKEMQEYLMSQKRNAQGDKLKGVKQAAEQKAEQDRSATVSKIEAAKEARRQLEEDREKKRSEEREANGNVAAEKTRKIKEISDGKVNEKAMKTLKELESKGELARQELKKVQDAQDRRRQLKSIRQEAYEISAARRRKQKDYKMNKLERELQNKEIRCNAIKKGFQVLGQMRNSMKDIMSVTTSLLKEEFHQLKHKDNFNPDTVVEKALEVSNKILIPRLENTFGVKPMVQENVFNDSADLFNFDFKADNFEETAKAFLDEGGGGGDGEEKGSPKEKATTKKIDPSILSLDEPNSVMPRTNFATLAVTTITRENVTNALMDSKKKIMEASIRPSTPSRQGTPSKGRHGQLKSLKTSQSAHSLGGLHGESSIDDDIKILRGELSSSHILDIGEGEGNPHKFPSKSSAQKKSQTRNNRDNGGSMQYSQTTHGSNERDVDGVDLPIFPFSPGGAGTWGGESVPEVKEPEVTLGSTRRPPPGKNSKAAIRTDVNEKAKYLDPPAGKFRREFSTDHPLAAKGTGKYDKEAKKGIKPTGLPDDVVKTYGSVKEAIDNRNKVEKLTFQAQSRLVDPERELEDLRNKQNETLKKIIEQERFAEEQRVQAKSEIQDKEEKSRMDVVFTEERRRANQRIIAATKEHEEKIKDAVLRMMDLKSTKKSNIDQIGKD